MRSPFSILHPRFNLRDGQKWRFKRVTIDNSCAEGDPEILTVMARHRVRTSKPKQPK